MKRKLTNRQSHTKQMKSGLEPYQPFDVFLARLVAEKKIGKGLLNELVGVETANRIQDNARNWMGAPALGAGTGVILHGQLHEYAGAIEDIKSRIANHWERVIKAMERQPQHTQKPAPEPAKLNEEFTPKPNSSPKSGA